MSGDDDALFAEAMGTVRRLPEHGKVQPEKPKPRPKVRERSAVATMPVGMGEGAQATDEAWVLAADGVSRERLKRLAAGKPAIEASFDLHGMTRDAAIDLLEREFAGALGRGCRVLAVIHGRGLHSDGRPVLKEAVYQWLQHGAFAAVVLAVVPQPGSGGGACLVLLRRH